MCKQYTITFWIATKQWDAIILYVIHSRKEQQSSQLVQAVYTKTPTLGNNVFYGTSKISLTQSEVIFSWHYLSHLIMSYW